MLTFSDRVYHLERLLITRIVRFTRVVVKPPLTVIALGVLAAVAVDLSICINLRGRLDVKCRRQDSVGDCLLQQRNVPGLVQ